MNNKGFPLKIVDLMIYVITFVIFLFWIYPFYYVLIISIMPFEDFNNEVLHLFPKGISFDYYTSFIQNPDLLNSYKISIIRTVLGVSASLVVTSMAAYVISKKKLKLFKILNVFVTIPMLFGGGMIPFYLVVRQLHLTNTLFGLIIPFLVGSYNLFILKSYFMSIPEELEESAQIDGANQFTIFWRIIWPVATPGLAVLVLLSATFHWNDFFWSGLLVSDQKLYTIAVQLRNMLASGQRSAQFQGKASSDLQSTAAVTMLIIIPIMIVYPFIQKYFTKGLMIGAVKG